MVVTAFMKMMTLLTEGTGEMQIAFHPIVAACVSVVHYINL